ncbi:hypothetical protein N657DRAFT_617732 [Parathielavia appendiculata]|uniref:HRDC domain-containing protein n=1 Tax=Parathielavia appendiculata TaxID=2587402 RepID=A0AAN6U1C4_9PEZI|nr:hypothetical protein N657DRAFT_617732 [Parathielavia appendiculata]
MRSRLACCLRKIRYPCVGITMDSSQELKNLRDAVQSALVSVTRAVNTLANEDLQFQRTVHPTVATRLDQNTGRLLQLASGVLKSAGKFTAQREPRLDDVDDVEIQWKGVVDVIDTLLEKSDTCLDEYTGLIKRKDAPTAESGRDLKRSKPATDRLDWSLKRANILKPQNAFEKKTDNLESGPWKPLLTTKPHAQTPLDASLTTFTDAGGHTQYKHPYEDEITNMRYPEQVYQSHEPIKYQPMGKTEAIWVDTYEGVLEMLNELKKVTEIAIDLEHHDYRTYPGLLSLMQISTREKDWIVDTLVPWRHKLEVLNEVFADPKIVKVLHGAFMDTIWLQRDLGLYVVGLFDTYYACDTLGYAGKSLAFLLKKFVDFDADKRYQLADWRIRPLPDEMFYYARSDTHYLLYIYDMLRNELAALAAQDNPDGNPIDRVIQKSKEVSLQRYEHPFCDSETGAGNRGWFNILLKSPALYNGEQFAVYKAVHKWRDDVARREDESPVFIMTQQVLSDIARIMPTDMKALWSLLESNTRGLKTRLEELFQVIQEARARGANGPTMLEFFRQQSEGIYKASLANQVKTSAKVEAVQLSIDDMKSTRSQLWGDVALNSTLDGTSKARPMDYQEMIPLYTFDLSAFTESLPEPAETVPSARAQELEPEPVEEDEGFTLRSGRKRKAVDLDTTRASEDESASAVETDESEAADEPDSLDADSEGEGEAGSEDDAAAHKTIQGQPKKKRREASEAVRNLQKAARRKAKKLREQGDPKATKQLLLEAKQARRAEKKRQKREQREQEQQQQQAAASSSIANPLAAADKQPTTTSTSSPGVQQDENDHQQQQQEQPFDYTRAASVLHAPKDQTDANGTGGSDGQGKKGKRSKKKKEAFDPYAKKAGDAPVGARKMNYERSGRTATFKK